MIYGVYGSGYIVPEHESARDFDAGDEMELNGEGSLGPSEPAYPQACLLLLASTNQPSATDATLHDRRGSVST